MKLVERDKQPYFLYNPDSTPQPAGGPSAWGAAGFISAVDEGLAGIVDIGVNYDEIAFSPRFPVTEYTELRYLTGYEVSKVLVDVRYILDTAGMRYDIYSPAKTIRAHILMPKFKTCSKALVNGSEIKYVINKIVESVYIDFIIDANSAKASIEILFV